MKYPSLEDWNWIQSMCTRALIGAISANFRQVVLSFRGNKWLLIITLEKDTQEDYEEIEEIVDEFSLLIDDIKSRVSDLCYVRVESLVKISSKKLTFDDGDFIIFRRKE